MVNDLLKECYTVITVPHMVRLIVGGLTIDNYLLSMVVAFAAQIIVSVGLDERKRLIFRPFRKIWARIGGITAAVRAALSAHLLSS
ncbi:hypothetical protein AWN88_01415 [Agrobacterium tumefaciens]|nr:hypothetical protein AWN88_01415 [Agrobacterium tumefaciens]KAJ34192.1 hypothetical protein BW45_05620 [Agrobacterium tumefaciens]